jgi:acyl-coenzyme A thioesterase PaaI-like protein
LGIEVPLVRAEGHALHVGKRIASADGRLVDAEGKLYATATTSCIVTPDTT